MVGANVARQRPGLPPGVPVLRHTARRPRTPQGPGALSRRPSRWGGTPSPGPERAPIRCPAPGARHSPLRAPRSAARPGIRTLSPPRFVRERLAIAIVIVSGAGEAVDRVIGLEVGRRLLARLRPQPLEVLHQLLWDHRAKVQAGSSFPAQPPATTQRAPIPMSSRARL